ncbi:hypothetical protein FE783_36120 [Paenibacillus mesophilus]|uniref:hypothetical protein n=1 Tax=Paenibacillus mesophilus TaxID=2582849 RepID=UPI00110DE6C1|nr:hypothetical protein [Paenibacillus mesophilus]TMV43152.1 hypothetical protein FE783_36120 [Paenibacillus mesophilus]
MGKRIQKLVRAGLAGCMAVTMIHVCHFHDLLRHYLPQFVASILRLSLVFVSMDGWQGRLKIKSVIREASLASKDMTHCFFILTRIFSVI